MRDSQTILRACQKEAEDYSLLTIATVVLVEGSTYRRPGARMLIFPNGRRLGSISGGCLEADVIEHAKGVSASGKTQFLLYNSHDSNGDLIIELGCKGAVGILIERVREPIVSGYLNFLAQCCKQRQTGVIATVFRVTGVCPVGIGEHLLMSGAGSVTTDIDFAPLRFAIEADAFTALNLLETENKTYRFNEGTVDVLIEAVVLPISLLICGAGYDSVPLAEGAARLGWQVSVADHQSNYLTADRFPSNVTLIETFPNKILQSVTPDDRTVTVIMTHNAAQDRSYLQELLPSPMRYIGLLGPRARGARLLAEIEEEGNILDSADPQHLYSPAGLDIGSETPEEIALAILAEIQTALTNGSGNSLRERHGSIHLPVQNELSSPPLSKPLIGIKREICPTSA